MSKNVRDVNPFLQKFRNFLLGRKLTNNLRFPADVATRSPPLPDLPDGPSHRLSANYYYTRDARREVCPPEVIVSGQQLIGPGGSALADKCAKGRTPGKLYHWD